MSTTPQAKAAGGWLARQLALSGDVVQAADGSTDWGTTTDVLLGMASSGVAGDQIAVTAAKLAASGEEYIGAAASARAMWAQIAKTALTLEVVGGDPTRFDSPAGPRDLIAELRSVLNADGTFGDVGPYGYSAFSHAYAVLALARTDEGVPEAAIDQLRAQQCDDGTSPNFGSFGWATDCSSPDTDVTALAAQALEAATRDIPGGDVSVNLAMLWVETQQDASGGITSVFMGPNVNSSGLYAQNLVGGESRAQAMSFIAGMQITCDTVAAHDDVLTVADVGAIAANQDVHTTVTGSGLTVDAAALLATAQGVLGLGGPRFVDMTVAGAQAATPEPTCANEEPTPSETPSPTSDPSPSLTTTPTDESSQSESVQPPADSTISPVGASTQSGATASTGGSILSGGGPLAGLAAALMAAGALVWAAAKPKTRA